MQHPQHHQLMATDFCRRPPQPQPQQQQSPAYEKSRQQKPTAAPPVTSTTPQQQSQQHPTPRRPLPPISCHKMSAPPSLTPASVGTPSAPPPAPSIVTTTTTGSSESGSANYYRDGGGGGGTGAGGGFRPTSGSIGSGTGTTVVRPIKQSIIVPAPQSVTQVLPPLESRNASTDDGFDEDHELLVVQLPPTVGAVTGAVADADLPPEVATLNAQWRTYAAVRCGIGGGRGLPGPAAALFRQHSRDHDSLFFDEDYFDDGDEYDDYDVDGEFRGRRRTITSRFPVPSSNGGAGGNGGTPTARRLYQRQRKLSQGDASGGGGFRRHHCDRLEEDDGDGISGGGGGGGGGGSVAPAPLGARRRTTTTGSGAGALSGSRRRLSSPERSLLSANYAFLRRSMDQFGLEIVAAFDRCHSDAYRNFLQSLTCYDLAPAHGMIVMLDAQLPIRKAIAAVCTIPPPRVAVICNIQQQQQQQTPPPQQHQTESGSTGSPHGGGGGAVETGSIAGCSGSSNGSSSSNGSGGSSTLPHQSSSTGSGGSATASSDLALFSVTDCLHILRHELGRSGAEGVSEGNNGGGVEEMMESEVSAAGCGTGGSLADQPLQHYIDRLQRGDGFGASCGRKRGLVSVNATTTVWDLARVFLLNRVHRIPVFEGGGPQPDSGEILSILCPRLICAELLKLIDHTAPKCPLLPNLREIELGQRLLGTWNDIATITTETSVGRAIDVLLERRVSAIAVVDPENSGVSGGEESPTIVGVLDKGTVVDTLAHYGPENFRDIFALPVKNVMQPCVYAGGVAPLVPPGLSVADACRLLVDDGFRESLFVVGAENRLLGVVSHMDIIGYLLSAGSTPEASPTPGPAGAGAPMDWTAAASVTITHQHHHGGGSGATAPPLMTAF